MTDTFSTHRPVTVIVVGASALCFACAVTWATAALMVVKSLSRWARGGSQRKDFQRGQKEPLAVLSGEPSKQHALEQLHDESP